MTAILYSKDSCAPCGMVKKYLDRRGVAYIERNIKKQEWLDKLVEDYHVTMVPVVVFSDNPHHVVVGYNLKSMAAIIRQL